MHQPDEFSTFPVAFVPTLPFHMLHPPQVMPGLYGWTPIVEAITTALYTGKVFAAKDNLIYLYYLHLLAFIPPGNTTLCASHKYYHTIAPDQSSLLPMVSPGAAQHYRESTENQFILDGKTVKRYDR